MKVYLHYDAFFECELPDINTNSLPWQIALRDIKQHVIDSLPDEWIIEFVDVIPG